MSTNILSSREEIRYRSALWIDEGEGLGYSIESAWLWKIAFHSISKLYCCSNQVLFSSRVSEFLRCVEVPLIELYRMMLYFVGRSRPMTDTYKQLGEIQFYRCTSKCWISDEFEDEIPKWKRMDRMEPSLRRLFYIWYYPFHQKPYSNMSHALVEGLGAHERSDDNRPPNIYLWKIPPFSILCDREGQRNWMRMFKERIPLIWFRNACV